MELVLGRREHIITFPNAGSELPAPRLGSSTRSQNVLGNYLGASCQKRCSLVALGQLTWVYFVRLTAWTIECMLMVRLHAPLERSASS